MFRLHRFGGAIFLALMSIATSSSIAQVGTPSSGPDVIVGFVDATAVFGQDGAGPNSPVGVTAATNSCNRGTANLNWYAFPDARHPVIAVNLYRLSNQRMEQLGQSWVKHGFFATNQDACFGVSGFPHATCIPGAGGQQLGPGCSDLYGTFLNSEPGNLGPRSRINPATGAFINPKTGAPDALHVKDPVEDPIDPGKPPSALQKIIYVLPQDLLVLNARYFVEAHYIAADDAGAGNARNNTTYREVKPIQGPSRITFQHLGEEVRGEPAIKAWDGATFFEKTEAEGLGGEFGSVIVASKAVQVVGNLYRYEYAIYNMNSDLAVQSFTVPAGRVQVPTIGSSAVPSFGERWAKDPWSSIVAGSVVTWATRKFMDLPTANAIRWGSTYNFWFVADGAPTAKAAVIARFKPKAGASNPDTFEAEVLAPGT